MKIDGQCHCGFVAYEAEIDPDKIVICHCTDCQTMTGSAFRIVALSRENTFRLLAGTPKVYEKIADSGTRRLLAFCPECGTPIHSTTAGDAAKIHAIRVGTIRQRDQLVPTLQLWCRSAPHWIEGLASIRKMETQPPFDPRGGVN